MTTTPILRKPRDPNKPHKSPAQDARKVDAVDKVIASRIAQRRMALRMTQGALAKAIGLTFQQVQKYESGSNRIAGGTLFKVAKTLGVTVDYFYKGAGEITPIDVPDDIDRLMAEGGRTLAADYLALPPPQRKMVANLARSLASENKDVDA